MEERRGRRFKKVRTQEDQGGEVTTWQLGLFDLT